MASFQKNFVVKNGLEVGLNNGSILVATVEGVGIGSTVPGCALSVVGDSKISGITTFGRDVVVDGNLTVNGTETIINTSTLEVEDINIGIASATNRLNDSQLDGAGITIYGSDGDKTLLWDNSNSRLAFNTSVYAPSLSAIHSQSDGLSVAGVSTLTNKLEIRSDDSSPGRVDFYCEVNNLHRVRLEAPPHANFSGNPVVVLPNSSGTLLLDDGSGASLTNLNADNLSSGTIPDARFPATLPAADGSALTNLTNLNASQLSSGTIPDARFPAVLPAVDGSALTNLVAGIGIGTASGSVGFGITVLNFEGPGVSTAFLDQTTGIGTVFFEGGGGGGSISVSLTPPNSPASGDLWYSPNHARTFIYYDESVVGYGTDSYWIDAAPFHIPPGNAVPGISTTGTSTFNNLSVSGVVTATSYYGSGANLTGITESQITDLGNYATVSYVNSEVAGIVSAAPATLDTLNELAAALNDDANFATTVTNQLALKADLSEAEFTGIATFTTGAEFTGITTFTKVIKGREMVLSGIGTANEFDALSDINYKKNIKTVENGLDKIVSLRGVSYDWKQSDRPSYGVIAQELEEVLPELVHGGFGNDPKTVNYNGIIGVMIESIKELKQEVETLKKIINN